MFNFEIFTVTYIEMDDFWSYFSEKNALHCLGKAGIVDCYCFCFQPASVRLTCVRVLGWMPVITRPLPPPPAPPPPPPRNPSDIHPPLTGEGTIYLHLYTSLKT